MPAYTIRIALAIVFAAAATLGAMALFIREAATLSEPPQKEVTRTLQTENKQKSPPEEPAVNSAQERPRGPVESPAPETLPDGWKTVSESKPAYTVALESSDLAAKAFPTAGGNDNLLEETKDIFYTISASKAEIAENLSSPRVKMTKEVVNKIFNTGIRTSFSRLADPKFKFEVLSGDLKVEPRYALAEPKATGRTVNLYKIGAALGGETYVCLAAAKTDCVATGQTDKACEHPQKGVLQTCIDKAMGSSESLISSQLRQDAG